MFVCDIVDLITFHTLQYVNIQLDYMPMVIIGGVGICGSYIHV